ncbi:hypothetical protein LG208_13425 [Bacillus paralicheniformis]|nr:hypothetical protein [Bacillus paralicheniformis]MBZ5212959.1 hypothetical protein [Bacillus paralicheniformis]MCY1630904.1 hypothetical protein [Bacillus paralicheniformis]
MNWKTAKEISSKHPDELSQEDIKWIKSNQEEVKRKTVEIWEQIKKG